jgi:hypothetical protein
MYGAYDEVSSAKCNQHLTKRSIRALADGQSLALLGIARSLVCIRLSGARSSTRRTVLLLAALWFLAAGLMPFCQIQFLDSARKKGNTYDRESDGV